MMPREITHTPLRFNPFTYVILKATPTISGPAYLLGELPSVTISSAG